MNRIGLDTSVVLRLLTGLPENQATNAREFLTSAHDEKVMPVVSDLVVAETYYALCYHYEVPKRDAVRQLRAFLESGWVEPVGIALTALSETQGGQVGLVDRMIRQQSLQNGHDLVTFDSRLSRLPHVRLLQR